MRRLALLALLVLLAVTPLPAATGTIMPSPFQLVLDSSGNPVSGACVWTYTAGTLTAAKTYTDVNLTVENTNPIQASPAGRFTAYLALGASYKFAYETTCTPPAHGSPLITVDNVAAVPGSAANLDIVGTAGEALTAGQAVYLSDGSGGKTAGLWYKADQTNTYSSTTPEVGMAPVSITSLSAGTIRLSGSVTGLSSLTIGAEYYVGAAGAITSSAPANKRHVGHADTTSTFVLTPNPSTNFLQVAPTMTNGQLIIGSTGAVPVAAALTAGGGITTTTGAGTLTVTNAGAYTLDRQLTLQTVANTAAETTVYTFAVAGGTLGTTRALELVVIGDHLINNGAPDGLRVRVKYGATTICDANIAAASINNGANRGSLYMRCRLQAMAATNVQRAEGFFQVGDSSQNNAAGAFGNINGTAVYTMYGVHNSVAEDSTASKNLVVTFQPGTANALIDMRAHTITTELR